jgi:hypothetical protein
MVIDWILIAQACLSNSYEKKGSSNCCSSTLFWYHLNCMVQGHSWETNNSTASQEIPHILCNQKVHYCVHKSRLLVLVLSCMNSPCPLILLLSDPFCIILPSIFRFSKCSLLLCFLTDTQYAFFFFLLCDTCLAHFTLNKSWSTSLCSSFYLPRSVSSPQMWNLVVWSHVYRWQSSQVIPEWSQQCISVQWLVGMFATWCPPVQMALFHSGATTVSVLGSTHSCEFVMLWLYLLWAVGRKISRCVCSSGMWHCVTRQTNRGVNINCTAAKT